MKSIQKTSSIFALTFFFTGAIAQAASVAGTVTDKTTNKPAVGDSVVLVDVQAGMDEVAKAVTDGKGHYSLNEPGAGPYLVRVTHQGAAYFIAAPQGAGPGDIPVYDVAAKVSGVFIEADVLELETANGQLHVNERYYVHNTSSPPTTQWSAKSFEVVLPADADEEEVGAQRPGGLPTSVKMDPDGPKGHYSFNFPIQPDNGDKDTLFQIGYTLPYSSGKYIFKSQVSLPADNFAVLMPKTMSLSAATAGTFTAVNADPGISTYLYKNATPGKVMEFTVSGTGSIPREDQGTAGASAQGSAGTAAGASTTATPGTTPGGGLGEPINTPDPLTKYKWWILGGLALLLAAGAAFLLRKPEGAGGVPPLPQGGTVPANYSSPTAKNALLLNALKEELFSLESEKIAGTLSAEDYAEAKSALETVLKRALKRSS
jgi:hypothetical protein